MNSSILFGAPVQYALLEIVQNLIVSTLCGIAIALVYKWTHRGVSYSQSFVSSLVLITVLAATVIMVIGNSLARAFGLVGAFTLIRFRSAVKDVRDMTFLFLALVIGIGIGIGAYALAISALVFVLALATILGRINIGLVSNYDYLLRLTLRQQHKEHDPPYKEIFEKHLRESTLLNIRSLDDRKRLEVSFTIRLKDRTGVGAFVQELGALAPVEHAEVTNMAGDIEY